MVNIFQYRSHRPESECKSDSPFYLGVNRMNNPKHWFKSQPLGEKQLKSLMKSAVAKSNVSKNKKLTNHSGRKTAITRLLDEGIPVTSVQQHSGHKSLASINNYAKNSSKTQKKMSNIRNRIDSNVEPKTDVPLLPEAQDQEPVSKTNNTKTPNEIINTKNETDNVNSRREVSNMSSSIPNLFPAGTIINGGTFNLFFGSNKENVPIVKPSKRKFVIESDSDSD